MCGDRTRVSLQLQQGFSIGTAAVRPWLTFSFDGFVSSNLRRGRTQRDDRKPLSKPTYHAISLIAAAAAAWCGCCAGPRLCRSGETSTTERLNVGLKEMIATTV